MVPQLATSVFSSGANEAFATIDGYKAKGQEIINSLPINLKDAKDIFASIKFTNDSFDILGTAKSLSSTVVGEYLKTTVAGMGLGVSLNDLGSGIVSKTTALLSTTIPEAQDVMCKIGDYVNKASVSDYGRVAKLGYALSKVNGVSGAISVLNQGQYGALLGNMIGEASDTGIGGVLSSLKNTIDENGVFIRVAKAAVPFVLKNSDVSLLRELTNGVGGKLMNTVAPGFAKSFMSTFAPVHKYNLSRTASFNSIIDSFDGIYSNWDKSSQNGESITSIVSMLSGTKEFKTLMGSGIAWVLSDQADAQKKKRAQDHALSRIYGESTVQDQIKKYFPGLVITGQYSKRLPKKEAVNIQLLGRSINAFLS